MTQIDNSGTPTGPHVVLNIGYDNLQRETSLSATVAGTLDFLNNYAYDANSQLTQVTQQGQTGGNTVAAKLVNLAYDHDGNLLTVSRYANLAATQLVATSTYGYNADAAVTSLSRDKGATNLSSSTYTYDHDGRVTGDSTVDGTDSYTYDADDEVTAATHSYETNESYSFGATGNRTGTGFSSTTDNELTSDGTYNYTYDANGNLTKKTTISTGAYVTYTWDYRNRLTDVESYNSSNVLQSHIHYTYDVFNRLIEEQIDPTGGGTYTSAQSFVYDNSGNIVLVYNASGTLTDRLFNGPDANDAIADESGSGAVSWYLKDREGSTRDVVQYNSGTNTTTDVDQITYGAFGNITAQTNSADQPVFTYTGQMLDTATGLYYYHARWYDASTGRFISQDPTGFAAGDANLYRYVDNSPTNAVDPTGTDSMDAAAMAPITAPMEAQMQAVQDQEEQQMQQTAQSQPAANTAMLTAPRDVPTPSPTDIVRRFPPTKNGTVTRVYDKGGNFLYKITTFPNGDKIVTWPSGIEQIHFKNGDIIVIDKTDPKNPTTSYFWKNGDTLSVAGTPAGFPPTVPGMPPSPPALLKALKAMLANVKSGALELKGVTQAQLQALHDKLEQVAEKGAEIVSITSKTVSAEGKPDPHPDTADVGTEITLKVKMPNGNMLTITFVVSSNMKAVTQVVIGVEGPPEDPYKKKQ